MAASNETDGTYASHGLAKGIIRELLTYSNEKVDAGAVIALVDNLCNRYSLEIVISRGRVNIADVVSFNISPHKLGQFGYSARILHRQCGKTLLVASRLRFFKYVSWGCLDGDTATVILSADDTITIQCVGRSKKLLRPSKFYLNQAKELALAH